MWHIDKCLLTVSRMTLSMCALKTRNRLDAEVVYITHMIGGVWSKQYRRMLDHNRVSAKYLFSYNGLVGRVGGSLSYMRSICHMFTFQCCTC